MIVASLVHPHEEWWVSIIKVLVIINLVMVAFAYTTQSEGSQLAQIHDLRAQWFSPVVVQAFFAGEEAAIS